MRMKLVSLVALWSLVALAQPTPGTQARPAVRQLDLEADDAIVGEASAPMVETTTAGPHPRREALVRVRTSFADKVLQSVHEL